MAARIPAFTLNNGTKIPSVGMGCWMGKPGGEDRVVQMCKLALKNGYRHFDTAFGYGNEEQVGLAIRESGIPRNEIYITSKLPNHHHHRVRESFDETLQSLNCEYLDLYLIHWPQASVDGKMRKPDEFPTIIDTWKEMEKLLATGKVKSIGVSNFSVKTLTQLLPHCTVVPAMNQVELHPCLPQNELKAFCDEKGILLTAYSPLGRGNTFFEDATTTHIAEKNKATVAQVLVSWGVKRGIVSVPKSENDQRMLANITLVDLSEEDMDTINALHKKQGMHKSLLTYHGSDVDVFGWTYEWMGWNFTKGGVVPN